MANMTRLDAIEYLINHLTDDDIAPEAIEALLALDVHPNELGELGVEVE